MSMVKIGVIADTHLESASRHLKEVSDTYFRDTDLILHAGDLVSLEVLSAFEGKDIYAVAGNRDQSKVRQRLPETRVIQVKGFRIGLVHGWGLPFGLQHRVAGAFEGVNCVVFGHSHWPVDRLRGGVLYFNPGAFRPGPFFFWRKSIGLLTVGQDISGRIIRI